MKNIKILNTEFANFGSIQNILNQIGYKSELIDNVDNLENEKIIIPGVGNFSKIMEVLKKKNLIENVTKILKTNQNKFFCICVGMQILFEESEEGDEKGLGIFKGKFKKFKLNKLRVPHQGWNYVKKNNFIEKTLADILDKRFYYSHSFYVDDNQLESGIEYNLTNYEIDFISVIKNNNILATQFHPEKSHVQGIQLFKYFCDEF
jgi:glutamine amidotransferase